MMAPGLYSWNYISYMQSQWHCWFQAMGYGELDILRYEDGTWYIIQYFNAPNIPAETKWQVVLGPMKNVEISYAFCHKYVQQLDMNLKSFWLREEKETQEVVDEFIEKEERAEDTTEQAYSAIRKNPALMNRIARNGLREMDLSVLSHHVPKSEKTKTKFKGTPYVRDSSIAS